MMTPQEAGEAAQAVSLALFDSPVAKVGFGALALVVVFFLVRELRNVPAKLHVLMFTAFLDMVGALIIVPLLPFYAKRLGGDAETVGILVSSFAVAQLVSAPMWGRFSDKFGRRPTLLVALAASAIAFVIFGYAESIFTLFVSRIVLGAGGGTVGVIQAYVADATEPKDRARSLGWLSAATNLGVALGPVIGSWAAGIGANTYHVGSLDIHIGHAAPGLLAAALCVLNIGFAFKYLTESKHMTEEHATRTPGGTPAAPRVARPSAITSIRRVMSHPGEPAARLIWIYAITMGAFMGVNAILALFLASEHGVTESSIGYFFMYIGVISVITRVMALGRLVDWLGEPRLSRVGMVLLALGLGGLPLARGIGGLAVAVALIPLGTAFTFPCVTAMLSRVTDPRDRGLFMGVQQTFGGAARVLFPVLMGTLFKRLGHGWPFAVGATLVLLTITLGLGLEKAVKPKSASTPTPA
ncbi:MAG: MFS transporter [Gemmatimonadetes bacterium]|nr:MFS transporter [Gemmatimonadota bacterium]